MWDVVSVHESGQGVGWECTRGGVASFARVALCAAFAFFAFLLLLVVSFAIFAWLYNGKWG